MGGLREYQTYEFREDLHKLPQMVLVHMTMKQVSVGWRITSFRIPGVGIEGLPIWINHDVPMRQSARHAVESGGPRTVSLSQTFPTLCPTFLSAPRVHPTFPSLSSHIPPFSSKT